MCVTSNFLPKVLCILLICVQYCCSHSYYYAFLSKISVRGNFISLSKDQALFKVGEAPEIFCTGKKTDNLSLYETDEFSRARQLPVEVINATTIRYKVNKTKTPTKMTFDCQDLSMFALDRMTLLFDGPPDLINFHCMSKNLIFLNCTWNTTNIQAGFNLYTVNDKPSKICNIPVHEVHADMYDLSCIWNRNRTPRYTSDAPTLHLLMEYCNYTHCFNKTFEYNHLSIVKLDPPKLQLESKIRDGLNGTLVDVRCRFPLKIFNFLPVIIRRRVTLWSFPNRQESMERLLIVSLENGFLIQVQLPCYEQEYELRVSLKIREAVEEEYWSDYSSVAIKTENFVAKDGNTCEERKVEETQEIMLYLLKKFRIKFREEQSQLKKKIGELKARVAQAGHNLDSD